ncbi:MAG: tetratricopeptide repeat protein, partial [Desulfarculaceae bacterium]
AGEALKAFTSALSVWDVPLVRANLGVAYLQLGHLEEAERHLRAALEMDPKMPDAWTNLSSVLLQKGILEESAEASRKALELSEDFAMAHNNLAVALLDLDQADEARGHAQRALELGYPVHPDFLGCLGLGEDA